MARNECGHADGCRWPKDPCNCRIENPERRRTTHRPGCIYPIDPCCCDLREAEKGEVD